VPESLLPFSVGTHRRVALRIAGIAALLFVATTAFAQKQVLPARHIAPPVIDGVIGDEEWAQASVGEGAFDRTSGQRAAEPLKFWLASDDKYLYFAARLGDSQPGGIQETEYRTNTGLGSDDFVELDLDLSGSLADFNVFRINPRGATDVQLAGGRALKREWTGEFVAQGRVTASGWEMEARIPWQILVLPGAGPHDIRFNVDRHLQRLARDYVFFYDSGANHGDYPVWQAVTLPAQKLDRTLRLLPYTFAGYESDKHSGVINSGLDMKTMLTDKVPLVGTINPDFRNIENQILSLDFSRFERLAGESRPFFQEGAQYYNSALFASQRIGQFDAGLNSYGKLNNKLSFGALGTADFGHETDLVGNFTYDPTPNDSCRMSLTSLQRSHESNDAYLLRYSRQLGPLNVFVRQMGSQDSLQSRGNNAIVLLNYSRNGNGASIDYQRVSPNFLPRLGFFPEVDFKGVDWSAFLDHPYEKGTWSEFQADIHGLYYDRIDGASYRHNVAVDALGALRNGLVASFTGLSERFETYNDYLYTGSLGYPRGNVYRHIQVDVNTGRLEGFYYTSVASTISYRPLSRLQLNVTHQTVSYGGRQDQSILGFDYDLGRDQSVTGRAVRQQHDTNTYLAYRRSGNRGAEFYVIFGDPNALAQRSDVLIKAVFPIEVPI